MGRTDRWLFRSGWVGPDGRHLIWAICAFALWLNANPYIGLAHDARLYALMAYRWLAPEAFARDPWFMFGSQDDYSLFSPMLAAFFSTFGVARGAMLATLVQGLGFTAACIAITRAGLGRRSYPLALLLMVSFPVLYSPNVMLYVSEGFVSARGFAVPLSLAGLACIISGRKGAATAFLGTAFLVHPIMAATPLAVGILLLVPSRLRPWLLLVGVVAYILLLLMALRGHFPLVAGDWRGFLEPAILVFIDSWIEDKLTALILWAVLLCVAARYGAPALRGLYGIIPVVAFCGIVFSVLATVVPWVTALQAQFWRGIWLMKLMALCAIADLLWHYVFRPEAESRRIMSIGAALALLLAFDQPLAASLVLISVFQLRRSGLIEGWLARHSGAFGGILVVLLLMAIPGFIFELAGRVADVDIQGTQREVLQGLWRNAGFGLLTLGLWLFATGLPPRQFAAIASLLLAVTTVLWDIRSDGEKKQEARYALDGRYSLFGAAIPRGATVSWHKGTEQVWFELATASYAGSIHATGLVFSEQRTLMLSERFSRGVLATLAESPHPNTPVEKVRSAALGISGKLPFIDGPILSSYENAGAPTPAGIAWLCQDPELDFVVDELARPESVAQADGANGRRLHLYRCDHIAARRRG